MRAVQCGCGKIRACEYITGAGAWVAGTMRRLEECLCGTVYDLQFSFEFKMASPECFRYESYLKRADQRRAKVAAHVRMHAGRPLPG